MRKFVDLQFLIVEIPLASSLLPLPLTDFCLPLWPQSTQRGGLEEAEE